MQVCKPHACEGQKLQVINPLLASTLPALEDEEQQPSSGPTGPLAHTYLFDIISHAPAAITPHYIISKTQDAS
jgi:hypothetical protein